MFCIIPFSIKIYSKTHNDIWLKDTKHNDIYPGIMLSGTNTIVENDLKDNPLKQQSYYSKHLSDYQHAATYLLDPPHKAIKTCNGLP